MKQRMRRPSLCTLAISEGCLLGEGFQIPLAQGSLGRGLTGSPTAGWGKEWPVLNGESEDTPQPPLPHRYSKEFNELFSKTVLLMILLIFTDFIAFHLLVHPDMSILFTKRYSMGFL